MQPGVNRFPQEPLKAMDTGLAQTLDTVSRWLESCTSKHVKCAPSKTELDSYPTRVLDIGRLISKVCVIETHSIIQREPYITLSHRWGSTRAILTVTNRHQLKNGIALRGLPKTFQDAIAVAQHLSIRYLWIDSLCIIQEGDDGQDWESESKRMGHIYANAYLNVSADETCEAEGLFFARDPTLYTSFQLKLQVENALNFEEWTSIDTDIWINEVNQSLLNQRGWVFQERVLARRVVHFCRRELFWECREKSLCESFPIEVPPPELFSLGDSSSMRRFELSEGSSRLYDPHFPLSEALYEVWDDIIKKYSGCQLTYPTDRLHAISGVSRHLKPIMNDQHIVGMWFKYLTAELAWWIYPHRERFIFGEEPPYFAPSFSWASVKGQINSLGPFLIGFLVNVECIPLPSWDATVATAESFTEDVFELSEYPKFKLKVICTLKQVRLRRIKDAWYMAMTLPEDRQGEELSSNRFCFFPFLDFVIPELSQKAFESESFYIIPWRNGPDAGEYDTEQTSVHSMLLKLIDLKDGTFRRIGWIMNEHPEKKRLLLQE
jgi:Heterokaryon incompatibility protein (HET)